MKNGVPTPLVMVMLASIDSTVRASPKSDILCVVCCDEFILSTHSLVVDERKRQTLTLDEDLGEWNTQAHFQA